MVNELYETLISAAERPQTTDTFTNSMGYDWTMPTLQYNSKWKVQRRIFSKFFSASNPSAYQPRITEFVGLLLPKLLDNPEDFIAHIKQCVLLLTDNLKRFL
jgi:hypothetical protein